MKVLLVHNNFSIQGGAEVFYREVGRVLDQEGHDVRYFSAFEDGLDGSQGRYFPPVANYSEGSLAKRLSKFPQMVYNRAAYNKMQELIADFKPDVVHAFAVYVRLTPSVLDAAHDSGVPVVMSCNDYKHICPSYKLFHHGKVCEDCKSGQFIHAVRNRCSHDSLAFSAASAMEAYAHRWMDIYRKNVDVFLFASEFMAKKTEEFWGSESFRWRMLRNPFDSAQYNLPAKSSAERYVLYFGRLIDEKGVDVLVKAAALQPGITIKIVGDGPDKVLLETLSKTLGCNNVEFLGPVWGEELDQILAGCEFVAVPSLWHENFPYVILQAFALGKPVLGSNRGGIPELVSHGVRGLIYEATEPKALAEAMGALWGDQAELQQMGKNAKTFADAEFNDQRFYETLMDIYSEVCPCTA